MGTAFDYFDNLELPAADGYDDTAAQVPLVFGQKPGLRVLVIDDNDDLREVMVLLLNQFVRTDGAASVEQALAMIATDSAYDVVLCDLMMPNGGADTWLVRCASIDPRLVDRTILLTGGATTEAALALVEARRGKVLFKPFEIQDLLPVIERVAGRVSPDQGAAEG